MNLQNKLDASLARATGSGDIPGVILCIADDKGVLYEGASGRRSLAQPAAMTVDTVTWFASMTKAVTGAAAMQLVERGKLSLDAPAAKVCPQLGNMQVLEGFDAAGKPRLRPARGTVTLRNLLTHSAGFSYEIWNADPARELESRGAGNILSGTQATLDRPLLWDPDTRWDYSPGIDWAGRMVEEVSGQRLGDFMRDHLFGPLGMTHTGFRLTAQQREKLAGVHARLPDGTLVPYPFEIDQNAPLDMGGHALYGPVPDYLRFTRMILGGGALDGTRVLEAQTVATMSQNQMGALEVTPLPAAPPFSNAADFWPGIPCKWGLSFMINTRQTPEGRSAGSLSWAGLANSYYWIDPVKKITGVISTQILPFFDAKVVSLFSEVETMTYQSRS
ncbi:MAG: serine hydrolase domain-containing protein [Panacagrimonas sp.]